MNVTEFLEQIAIAALNSCGLRLPGEFRLSLLLDKEEFIRECDVIHRAVFDGQGMSGTDIESLFEFRGTWASTCPGEILAWDPSLNQGFNSQVTPEMSVVLAHEVAHLYVMAGGDGADDEFARNTMLYTRDNLPPWSGEDKTFWLEVFAQQYLPMRLGDDGKFGLDLSENEVLTHFLTNILVYELADHLHSQARDALIDEFRGYDNQIAIRERKNCSSITGFTYNWILDQLCDGCSTSRHALLSDSNLRRRMGMRFGELINRDLSGLSYPEGSDYPQVVVDEMREIYCANNIGYA